MKWLPLPKIGHGIAIYPFSPSSASTQHPPSRPQTAYSTIQSPLLSPQGDAASIMTSVSASSNAPVVEVAPSDLACLISLEVGDEVFVLEQHGQWYRGYVLSSLEEGRKPNTAPIGVFPRTHVQIKEYIDMDPDETDIYPTRTDSLLIAEELEEHEESAAPWFNLTPSALFRSFSESHIETAEQQQQRPKRAPMQHPPPPTLPMARFDQSTITGSSEPLVDEIGACVSEWNALLYKYLEERRYAAFSSVRDQINYLFQARRQLLDQALSREELGRLRKEIIHRMVMLNVSQGREMIIRHPERGYILDANSTSLATLFRMHWKYALAEQIPITSISFVAPHRSSSTSAPLLSNPPSATTDTPPMATSTSGKVPTPTSTTASQQSPTAASVVKGAKFHHLFFDLKACVGHICQPGEYAELYFSLYNKADSNFLTEQFCVVLTYNGMPKDECQIGKLQTLFADLSMHDLSEHLYLVCRIVRLGSMKYMDRDNHFGGIGSHASILFGGGGSTADLRKHGAANLCRRPFGCAVLHLGAFLQKIDQQPADSGGGGSGGLMASTSTALVYSLSQAEHDVRIYTANSESAFATLHEDIINNNAKEFVKSTRAETLCVYLKLFYGQLDDILKTNAALLQGVPKTLRLGFPDVVFPDDERNELYVTIQSGDFMQFARTRNVQVTVCVRDNQTGDVVENALASGAGAPFTTYWESIVFYHEQRPRWNETFKVHIQEKKQWEQSHLFVTLKHKSSSGGNFGSTTDVSNGDKTFAMGYIPLFMPPAFRYFVADGVHGLTLYRYDRQLAHPRVYLGNNPWCYRSSVPFNMQHQDFGFTSKRHPLNNHASPSMQSLRGSPSLSSLSIADATSTDSLSEAASNAGATAAATKLVMVKDTLSVKTLLCSTCFTQNETLVKLLNWSSILEENGEEGYEELRSVLDKFTFVGEMEVVKFLNDIFDALLGILVYRHKEQEKEDTLCDEALTAMVWVLGMIQDRRFSNFRPVLDVYIDQRFAEQQQQQQQQKIPKHDYVYDRLLKAISRLCTDTGDPKKAKQLRTSMKVWEYLFRFIVQSRLMQQQTEEDGERELRSIVFKEELEQLLEKINKLMSPDQPSSMIGTQTLALQHFADTLDQLRRVFSAKEMVKITSEFVDCSGHVTGKLVGYRLAMILAIVKGPVFNDHTCRLGLAKNVFRWINVWINSYMAAAKNVIFAKQNEGTDHDHQQMRLPRVQWLEYLRLSLTIICEMLEKMRRLSGMASVGLSISSPSLSTLSRPISMATSGDEDFTEESNSELQTVTELALQLIPQLINAYKDLQRLTIQAVHASTLSAENTASASSGSATPPARTSRHSLHVRRDRSSSLGSKQVPSISSGQPETPDNNSVFAVVLQALATSPTAPFPSTYPFHSISNKNNPAMTASGNLAAMVTTGLLDITVVLLELFYLTPQQQWINYLLSMLRSEGADATAKFLRQIVHACMGILFGDSMRMLDESTAKDDTMHHIKDSTAATRKLPDNWLNLSVIAHQVVLANILSPAVTIFEFLSDKDSNLESVQDLWVTFFVGLLRVISSPRLEIESFLPQTQRVVWKLADNLRGAVGAKTLSRLWMLAGSGKQQRNARGSMLLANKLDGQTAAATVTRADSVAGDDDTDTFVSAEEEEHHPQDNEQPEEKQQLQQQQQHIKISKTQLELIPAILRPLCAVSLTLHDKVRRAAVSIIADIIAIELYTFDDLSRVQNLLISAIDILVMTENKGDEAIKDKIIPELEEAVEEKQLPEPLLEKCSQSMDSIFKFLELLLKIRGLPLDNDEFVDDRISARLKLMEFIRVIERHDIYIKYVHQLVELHLQGGNYIEAALTLRFHADLLPWDPLVELPAEPELKLSAQPAFARKEALYYKIMSYLEKGQAWELCIELCKELASQYETTTFDFVKYGEILKRQAQLAEDIVKKERYFSEYFRVAFYGRGFPPSVRNQQFIYRGLEWEKVTSFMERIQNQHPNAQLLSGKYATSSKLTDEQVRELDSELDAQYIQITAVTPEPNESRQYLFENPLVPDNVKKYYTSNDVYSFTYSRPFDKQQQAGNPNASSSTSKPEDDFLNLWTKKTVFKCEETFPTTARRSKVIEIQEHEISPIENAVFAMEKKNQELLDLEQKYALYLRNGERRPSTAGSVNISPFSMALNGAVDAPVNGGVALYRKAFLTDAYWEKNPDMRPWARRLRDAIHDQVS